MLVLLLCNILVFPFLCLADLDFAVEVDHYDLVPRKLTLGAGAMERRHADDGPE